MAEPVLSVSRVSKYFGSEPNRQYAVRDVSLHVMPGEILMLCGPSGSGKTTLLSIMGGILTPDTGEVRVGGQSMSGLDKTGLAALRLKHLGFIFQEYNLFPTLDCLGNVMVALDLQGIKGRRAEDEAAGKLAAVGLGERLHEDPARLSGGQKQRLAIARALAGNPSVLLADEPTAALDSQNGALIMGLIRELADKHGRAVVIVTHDPRIQSVADRVAFSAEPGVRLHAGRLPGGSAALKWYRRVAGPGHSPADSPGFYARC